MHLGILRSSPRLKTLKEAYNHAIYLAPSEDIVREASSALRKLNLGELVFLIVYPDKAVSFFFFNFKFVQHNESSQSLILTEVEKAGVSLPVLWIKRPQRLSTP